jgi:hypothetical protein
MVVSWAGMPCSLLGSCKRVQRNLLLDLYGQSNFRRGVIENYLYPEDGGSKFLQDVGDHIADYKVL